MTTTTVRVTGMTCGHCVAAVAATVGELDGIDGVDVDLATGVVSIHSVGPIDRADIAAAVDAAGFAVQL